MAFAPVRGQEMVIKDVDDHRCVVSVLFPEQHFAFEYLGMRIGEPVDFPVEFDPKDHAFGVSIQVTSLHEISDEVAHDHVLRLAGQVYMCQEVQFDIRIIL